MRKPNQLIRTGAHISKYYQIIFLPVIMTTVIHFYFGADLISVISVQAFFTEIKSLPKF